MRDNLAEEAVPVMAERREREKMGEMNLVGPATVKTGTHKKIESGFESGLD